MGKGLPGYFAHQDYNISPDDVARLILHCEPCDIQSRVIITPCWNEDFLSDVADDIETVAEEGVYDISYRDSKLTLIRSGVGAPLTGDTILALGCTPCKYLIFTGSFGGLTDTVKIGDLMTITESIGGDGFSSYLAGSLSPDSFLKPAKPDIVLNELLEEYAVAQAKEKNVNLHKGRIFCSDTLVAEYFHCDTMSEKYGCIGVEMETSAVFNASVLVGIKATAFLMVSDVIPVNKSLFSGRTEEDRERRRYVRKSVLSRIILDTLCDERLS